jgi:hypothetical protein
VRNRLNQNLPRQRRIEIMDKTYHIETVYTLKQPLSHVGESESTETFLNTVRVLNGGKPVEVFAYTGNAIRGAWRDCGAEYLLDRLDGLQVPKKTFHLLFSGGSISGDQTVDISAAKALRAMLPFVSIFGGGIGNQILSGKIVQTFAFPVCAETMGIVPCGINVIDYAAKQTSWRKMTDEINFTRKDDSKDILGDKYIAHDVKLLAGDVEKKKKDEPATQMRYTVETLIPGVQLWHSLNITCNEVELGALVASIYQWAQKPFLGGMAGKGLGLVDANFEIVDNDGSRLPFISVKDGLLMLAEPAKAAKEQYDAQLRDLYNQYLDGNKSDLVKMLEDGGAKK